MATDAAPAPPADQAADLMQNLSLDLQNKDNDAPEATKKPSGVENGSAKCAEFKGAPTTTSQLSLTPLLPEHVDSSVCYIPNGYTSPYYYGGYDGSMAEWEEYPRYVSPDGLEVPPLGVYGDMYYHRYGYAPYSAYPSPGSPVPTVGHNGQLYGTQNYQYPTTYYQPPAPTGVTHSNSQSPTPVGDVSISVATDIPSIPIDTEMAKSNGVSKVNTNATKESAKTKSGQQNASSNTGSSFSKRALPGGIPYSGFGFGGMWSPVPWYDGPMFPDGQQRPNATNTASSATSSVGKNASPRNQNPQPIHLMGIHSPSSAASGMGSKMYPNNHIYTQSANGFGNGLSFYPSMYNLRENERWGMFIDGKYRPRGRGNGLSGYINENSDGLGELNKGPRSGRFRNLKGFEPTVTLAVRGQTLPTTVNVLDSSAAVDRDQYNKADFPVTHVDAKFFIIKSYSEDDVHKSVKYNVWASTPHGNKKLDLIYHESKEKSNECPVFLLFSVNTSGQFVGVAEMVGPVDFNKTFDYWQQDKWIGCFPVKWHIVKDVPNSILKHIILENNDNKPVTNSRDTQEIKLDQGLQLLKLFKEHASKTSILDDFGFYETRQKFLQERRAKHNLQKKAMDGRPADIDAKDKDGAKLRKPAQYGLAASGEDDLSEKSGVDATKADAATEKCTVADGVASF